METVGDLLSRKGYRVWTVDRGASLYEASCRMMETEVNSLIVLEDGAPAGIITSRDLVRAIAVRPDSVSVASVGDFMTAALETASEADDLAATQARMVALRFHHLPVTRDGNVVGVLDLLDVVKRQLWAADVLSDDLEAYITGAYPR